MLLVYYLYNVTDQALFIFFVDLLFFYAAAGCGNFTWRTFLYDTRHTGQNIGLSIFICSVRRACNLTTLSPCLTGPVNYLFVSCHEGPGFKSPGGYLCGTGILLLELSRYIDDPNMI
jgi:hypothetical protein